MRDLRPPRRKLPAANKAKNRAKRQRRPLNVRGFLKRLVRLALWGTALALVAVVGYETYSLLARATFLRLERIEVTGLKRLTRDEVIGLAGIHPGQDLLALGLRQVGAQLERSPWVEKVQVRRYFPHMLSITVSEREPAAVVNLGYLYYLDTQGHVFKPLQDGDRLDYPVLTGVTEEDLAKDPNGCREAFRAALGLIELLSKGPVFSLADVSEIHYDKGYGFTLFTLRGGVPIRLGSGDFTAKLGRLARIYSELQTTLPALQYIDLDYADKIIVKKA
jgi:cell division protein FtsQ